MHNPKVAGSNPAPATIKAGISVKEGQPFLQAHDSGPVQNDTGIVSERSHCLTPLRDRGESDSPNQAPACEDLRPVFSG